jgi:hypothetical protein
MLSPESADFTTGCIEQHAAAAPAAGTQFNFLFLFLFIRKQAA